MNGVMWEERCLLEQSLEYPMQQWIYILCCWGWIPQFPITDPTSLIEPNIPNSTYHRAFQSQRPASSQFPTHRAHSHLLLLIFCFHSSHGQTHFKYKVTGVGHCTLCASPSSSFIFYFNKHFKMKFNIIQKSTHHKYTVMYLTTREHACVTPIGDQELDHQQPRKPLTYPHPVKKLSKCIHYFNTTD